MRRDHWRTFLKEVQQKAFVQLTSAYYKWPCPTSGTLREGKPKGKATGKMYPPRIQPAYEKTWVFVAPFESSMLVRGRVETVKRLRRFLRRFDFRGASLAMIARLQCASPTVTSLLKASWKYCRYPDKGLPTTNPFQARYVN